MQEDEKRISEDFLERWAKLDKSKRYCKICGFEVPFKDDKCPVCGTKPEGIVKIKDREKKIEDEEDAEAYECSLCGKEVQKDAKACPHCGTKFIEKAEDAEKEGFIEDLREFYECSECGKEVSKDAEECPHCGTSLKEEEEGDVYECSVCGALTSAGDKTCPVCGTAFDGRIEDLGKEKEKKWKIILKCPVCGEIIDEKTKTCPKCGTDVSILTTVGPPRAPVIKKIEEEEGEVYIAPIKCPVCNTPLSIGEKKRCWICGSVIDKEGIELEKIEKIAVRWDEEPEICGIKLWIVKDEDDWREWVAQGDIFYNANLPERALECYDRALSIKEDYNAYYNKGMVLYRLERYEDAEKCFRKCVDLEPDDEYAWYNLANTLRDMGRFEEAIMCYDEVIKLRKDFDRAWCGIGEALVGEGYYEEAIKAFDAALKIRMDNEVTWFDIGIALHKMGREDDALQAINKSIELFPKNWESHWAKGLILLSLKKEKESLSSFREAVSLNPHNPQVWYNLGRILENKKIYLEAGECYENAARLRKTDEKLWYLAGKNHYLSGRIDRALDCLRTSVEIEENAENLREYGIVLLTLGAVKDSIDKFERAVEINPKDGESYLQLGIAWRSIGESEKALNALEIAEKVHPNKDKVLDEKCRVLTEIGRIKDAIECVEEAVRLNPTVEKLEKIVNLRQILILKKLAEDVSEKKEEFEVIEEVPVFEVVEEKEPELIARPPMRKRLKIAVGLRDRNALINGRGLINGRLLLNGNGIINGYGLVNGLPYEESAPLAREYRIRKKRATKRKIMKIGGMAAVAVILILFAPLLAYFLMLPTPHLIDGDFLDWKDEFLYRDSLGDSGNPDTDMISYSIVNDDNYIYGYIKVDGYMMSGGENGTHTIYVFIDVDDRMETGYRFEDLGAEYVIEMTGYNGRVRWGKLMEFNKTRKQYDWNAFEKVGGVKAAVGIHEIEFSCPIASINFGDGGINNATFGICMRDEKMMIDSSDAYIKIGMSSCVIHQKTEKRIISEENAPLLIVNISSVRGMSEINILKFRMTGNISLRIFMDDGNGIFDENDVEIGAMKNNEIYLDGGMYVGEGKTKTLFITSDGLKRGNLYGASIIDVSANNTAVKIVGTGKDVYFKEYPSRIVIDGIFEDWKDVKINTDERDAMNPNIDIVKYAVIRDERESFFFLSVDGYMLAGTDIPQEPYARPSGVGVVAPSPAPTPPPHVPKPIKTGEDYVLLYIDADMNDSTGYYYNGIASEYCIQISGINGEIISSVIYEWENSWTYIGDVKSACDGNKMEFSLDMQLLNIDKKVFRSVICTSDWLDNSDSSAIFKPLGGVCMIDVEDSNIVLVNPAEKNVPVFYIRISSTEGTVYLLRVNFTVTHTEEVDSVSLYRDVNKDGIIDKNDEFLSSSRAVSGIIPLTFGISEGYEEKIIVAVNLSDEGGYTFRMSLLNITTTARSVFSNLPHVGREITVKEKGGKAPPGGWAPNGWKLVANDAAGDANNVRVGSEADMDFTALYMDDNNNYIYFRMDFVSLASIWTGDQWTVVFQTDAPTNTWHALTLYTSYNANRGFGFGLYKWTSSTGWQYVAGGWLGAYYALADIDVTGDGVADMGYNINNAGGQTGVANSICFYVSKSLVGNGSNTQPGAKMPVYAITQWRNADNARPVTVDRIPNSGTATYTMVPEFAVIVFPMLIMMFLYFRVRRKK